MPNQEKNYYRNKIQIGDIDPDSLWQLKEGKFILVDDDEYFEFNATPYFEDFYQVFPEAE